MSINRQAIIDAFIERQRDNYHQFIHNLTSYYSNFRSRFSSYFDKTNQRYLFLSILITFILLAIISLIIFEYRRLLKCIQKFVQFIYSYYRSLLIRIRSKFLQRKTPSIFNTFLNSKSHFREKFFNEFVRSLNQELTKRQVK